MHRYNAMSKKDLKKILYETYGIRMHKGCRKHQYINELIYHIMNDLEFGDLEFDYN